MPIKYIKYQISPNEIKAITVVRGQPYCYGLDGVWTPFIMMRGTKLPDAFDLENLPPDFDRNTVESEINNNDPKHFIEAKRELSPDLKGKNNILGGKISSLQMLMDSIQLGNEDLKEYLTDDLGLSRNQKKEVNSQFVMEQVPGIKNDPDEVNRWLTQQGAAIANNLLQKFDVVFQPQPQSKGKCLYLNDFDCTLTWKFVGDSSDLYKEYMKDPTSSTVKEKIKKNIKPKVKSAFEAIWNSGNEVAIISGNQSRKFIIEHLIQAGLSLEQIEKITIENPHKMTRMQPFIEEKFQSGITTICYFDDNGHDIELAKGAVSNYLGENKNSNVELYTTKVEPDHVPFLCQGQLEDVQPKPREDFAGDENNNNNTNQPDRQQQGFGRYHNALFTTNEAQTNFTQTRADHLPLAMDVSLGEGKETIGVMTWNVLANGDDSGYAPQNATKCSVSPEQEEARLQGIADDLFDYVNDYKPQFILLQEINENAKLYGKIREKLKKLNSDEYEYDCVYINKTLVNYDGELTGERGDPEIVDGGRHGVVTFYNKKKYHPIVEGIKNASELALPYRATETLFESNDEKHQVDIINAHDMFDRVPTRNEGHINDFLGEERKSKFSHIELKEGVKRGNIFAGDMNVTAAPLDEKFQNITTNVASPTLGAGVQIPYSIDAGFCSISTSTGTSGIKQLDVREFDPVTKQVKEKRSPPIKASSKRQQKEIDALKMQICCDESFKTEKLVDARYTIFGYEDYLKHLFGLSQQYTPGKEDPKLQVRWASNVNNQKGLGVSLPKQIFDCFRLINNPHFQIRVELDRAGKPTHYLVFARKEIIEELDIFNHCIKRINPIKELTQVFDKITKEKWLVRTDKEGNTLPSFYSRSSRLLGLIDKIDALEKQGEPKQVIELFRSFISVIFKQVRFDANIDLINTKKYNLFLTLFDTTLTNYSNRKQIDKISDTNHLILMFCKSQPGPMDPRASKAISAFASLFLGFVVPVIIATAVTGGFFAIPAGILAVVEGLSLITEIALGSSLLSLAICLPATHFYTKNKHDVHNQEMKEVNAAEQAVGSLIPPSGG